VEQVKEIGERRQAIERQQDEGGPEIERRIGGGVALGDSG
jgi:hypothetical protein